MEEQLNAVYSKTLDFGYNIWTYPSVDSHVMKSAERGNEWETFLLTQIKTIDFNEGDLSIDVGSYIGSHAISLGFLGSDVMCFEIVPKIRDLCVKNINTNKLQDKIELKTFGLSDIDDVNRVYKTSFTGTSSLDRKLKEYTEEGTTTLRKLDNVLEDDPRPVKFIKIDVEGHEWNVLRGCEKTIENHRPIIALESFKTKQNQINLTEFCVKYKYKYQILKSTDYWLMPI
tara:strand:+ start:375 stop:1061 length:687 start_codon:yes stop_codon:yes gene_type:complete